MNKKVQEDDAVHEDLYDTFDPNHSLIHIVINNVIKLEKKSKIQSCTGYKLIKYRKNMSPNEKCVENKKEATQFKLAMDKALNMPINNSNAH